jgi:hypothetical protein
LTQVEVPEHRWQFGAAEALLSLASPIARAIERHPMMSNFMARRYRPIALSSSEIQRRVATCCGLRHALTRTALLPWRNADRVVRLIAS